MYFVSTITSKQLDKAYQAALNAIKDIPDAHNRKRDHVFYDTLIKRIEADKQMRSIANLDGKNVLRLYTDNLGSSRKYADWCRKVEQHKVYSVSATGKTVKIGHYSAAYRVEDLIFVWR